MHNHPVYALILGCMCLTLIIPPSLFERGTTQSNRPPSATGKEQALRDIVNQFARPAHQQLAEKHDELEAACRLLKEEPTVDSLARARAACS